MVKELLKKAVRPRKKKEPIIDSKTVSRFYKVSVFGNACHESAPCPFYEVFISKTESKTGNVEVGMKNFILDHIWTLCKGSGFTLEKNNCSFWYSINSVPPSELKLFKANLKKAKDEGRLPKDA